MNIKDYVKVLKKYKYGTEGYYYTLINILECVYKNICKFETDNKKIFEINQIEKWDRDLKFGE